MSKDKATATASASGIGFSSLLTVAFIVLKLCKVIDWPWIWVLAPSWITLLIVIFVIIVMLIFLGKY